MAIATCTPNNNGGYDYDFIDTTPDRLVCKICHLPSRDPYLSVCCGHVFCKSCLDNVKNADTITNACPICRDQEFVTFPNKAVDREVRSLRIYCTNKERGCEWQGELNDINNHLDDCQFEEVKCSNECGKMIQRQYLTSHVETECPRRMVNCQYCHDTGEHQFIDGQHKEECPKLPLPCPNICEVGSVPREDMEAHRKECYLEMIQCEYYSVGCGVRMARKDKEKHDDEKMKEHLMMTKRKLDDIQQQLTLVNSLSNTSMSITDIITATKWSMTLDISNLSNHDQVCPTIIKMSEFNKNRNVAWYSDAFYTHNNGYRMCFNVVAAGHGDGKGTYLSVFLYLMKGPHDDELTWPLRRKFEIKLFNQISDSEHHILRVSFDDTALTISSRVTGGNRLQATRGWGRHRFISHDELHKITPKCQFLKDDCLFFQITKV